MSDSFETMLEGRFAALSDWDPSADWSDVVARAAAERPRRKRRLLLAAAFVTVAALVAAPAFGLGGHVFRLFSAGEPAPAPVARSFLELERGAPFQWRSAGEARKVLDVETPDGRVAVWAAPSNAGGFCIAVGTAGRDGGASTCDRDRSERLVSWPFSWSKPPDELVGGPWVLVGYALNRDAASVEVRFDDGERAHVPLTRISPPIDAGFFVLWVPRGHWLDGRERFDVVARDADGHALDHDAIEVGVPTP